MGGKYRAAVHVWRSAWDNVMPLLQFPPEIRKITYTSNAIESLNMMRKYTRNPTHHPERRLGDEVAVPVDPRGEQTLTRCTSLEAGDAGLLDPVR